jgi:hypothetical protein
MTKKQAKKFLIVVYVLAAIGALTVIDNGIRLCGELSNAVKNHHWNIVVVR